MHHQTTRAKVMEQGVAVEAAISQLLGLILNIDTENSKSLGYQNSALSFNAKVNLLTDLKFVPKEIARQFQLFSEIRNKFAHVQQVDSFLSCFEILKEQRKYMGTFLTAQIPGLDEEMILSTCFDFLCFNLRLWLELILKKTAHKGMQEIRKTTAIEMLRAYLTGRDTKEGKEQEAAFLQQMEVTIKGIEQDKEFLQSLQELTRLTANSEERQKGNNPQTEDYREMEQPSPVAKVKPESP